MCLRIHSKGHTPRRTAKTLLSQRRPADSWFLYPFLQGCYTGSWHLSGEAEMVYYLVLICLQPSVFKVQVKETPCYKQLILKGQYIPTVLRLRGRAPRQFSYKVSLWITNTAHRWSWGPCILKSTERHVGLLHPEDCKIWEVFCVQRWLCWLSCLYQHVLFMCK